jgi:small conductance mechanosensitive channel
MPILAGHPSGEIITLEWARTHGVLILVILGIALLVNWGAHLAVRRMQRRIERAESLTQELDLQRANTITHALSYLARVLIWTIAFLLILDQLGVNLALTGFFILLENQFGVGDIVSVNAEGLIAGRVEKINLRVTQIRTFDGTLHFIPNGTIELIGNKTRGWARAIVDVGIAYGEDVENARRILDELFEELREDETMKGWFFDGPSVLGVENLGEYEVVLRVIADVRPMKQWDAMRELRRRIKMRFDERGVEIPFPYRVMIQRHDDAPARQPK